MNTNKKGLKLSSNNTNETDPSIDSMYTRGKYKVIVL